MLNNLSGMPERLLGEVTEWSKVQHWKCCVRYPRTEGSNPSLSANGKAHPICAAVRLIAAALSHEQNIDAFFRHEVPPGVWSNGIARCSVWTKVWGCGPPNTER